MNNIDIDLSGMFIGLVVANNDELQRERIFCRIVGIHNINDQNSLNGIWVENANSSAYESGKIPKVNDYVYLMFLKDVNNEYDPNKAIYFGVVRYNI